MVGSLGALLTSSVHSTNNGKASSRVAPRVLVITVLPPISAPEADYGYFFCEKLAEKGCDVHVLTTYKSAGAQIRGAKVHPWIFRWWWCDLPTLSVALRAVRPDVVFLLYVGWVYNTHPMITFAPTLAKRLLPGVPFITQFAGSIGREPVHSKMGKRIRQELVRRAGTDNVDDRAGTLLRDSDWLVFLSKEYRDVTIPTDSVAATRSVVLPPPAIMRMAPPSSRQRGRELSSAADDDVVISCFGYLYPGKGIETLLQAYKILCESRTNVRLVMIGGDLDPNYANQMRQLSRDLKISDRVFWTGGYESTSDMASVYLRGSDVCVFPFDDGIAMNNSSVSAVAAHGLPMVATRGSMTSEQFVQRQNVYFCPPKDGSALAVGITEVIDDPVLRQRLSAGASKLAHDWFSWDRTIEWAVDVCDAAKNGKNNKNGQNRPMTAF